MQQRSASTNQATTDAHKIIRMTMSKTATLFGLLHHPRWVCIVFLACVVAERGQSIAALMTHHLPLQHFATVASSSTKNKNSWLLQSTPVRGGSFQNSAGSSGATTSRSIPSASTTASTTTLSSKTDGMDTTTKLSSTQLGSSAVASLDPSQVRTSMHP